MRAAVTVMVGEDEVLMKKVRKEYLDGITIFEEGD